MTMQTITRIFSSDIVRQAPVIETGITRDTLDHENAEAPDFAALVWTACTSEGWYDDSDRSSDVLCIYVKGE